MDWTLGRLDEFEYIRVDKTGMERERLEGVRTGSISENLNTTLKASGSLDVVGSLDVGDDFIRIYLNTTSDAGEVARFALGTFFASTPVRRLGGASSGSTVDLYSTLLQLDEDRVETTYTVPAGTNAVTLAASLVTAAGLSVVVTPSSSTTNTAATFEAGTSKLEIINHLLGFANYGSAVPDGMGRVVMAPYTNPAERQPVWTFTDDDRSIMLPEVEDEHDWYDTPNVVIVTSSNAEETMSAAAVNDDPASPYSTVSRGRRIVRHEQLSDADTQEALQAKADALLLSSSSNVNTATVKHTFAPFGIGDVVRLNYTAAGVDYHMAVQSRELALVPGVPTTSTMRRFIRG